ncbi:MAG: hypothetical protein O3C17_18060, partial [Planctomycetota bacterium]|nr:hypothetical protein [Planctomycetota bacterium]
FFVAFFLATVAPPYESLLCDRLPLINRAYDSTTNFSHELNSVPTVNRDCWRASFMKVFLTKNLHSVRGS